MRDTLKRTHGGFTLVELLVAAAILAFVLTGMLFVFVSCVVLNETNRNLSIAASHGQYLLEGIRHRPYANITGEINAGTWNGTAANIAANWGLTPLSSEVIATRVSGANPLTVNMTIRWNDRRQRARSLNLQTMIANF